MMKQCSKDFNRFHRCLAQVSSFRCLSMVLRKCILMLHRLSPTKDFTTCEQLMRSGKTLCFMLSQTLERHPKVALMGVAVGNTRCSTVLIFNIFWFWLVLLRHENSKHPEKSAKSQLNSMNIWSSKFFRDTSQWLFLRDSVAVIFCLFVFKSAGIGLKPHLLLRPQQHLELLFQAGEITYLFEPNKKPITKTSHESPPHPPSPKPDIAASSRSDWDSDTIG